MSGKKKNNEKEQEINAFIEGIIPAGTILDSHKELLFDAISNGKTVKGAVSQALLKSGFNNAIKKIEKANKELSEQIAALDENGKAKSNELHKQIFDNRKLLERFGNYAATLKEEAKRYIEAYKEIGAYNKEENKEYDATIYLGDARVLTEEESEKFEKLFNETKTETGIDPDLTTTSEEDRNKFWDEFIIKSQNAGLPLDQAEDFEEAYEDGWDFPELDDNGEIIDETNDLGTNEEDEIVENNSDISAFVPNGNFGLSTAEYIIRLLTESGLDDNIKELSEEEAKKFNSVMERAINSDSKDIDFDNLPFDTKEARGQLADFLENLLIDLKIEGLNGDELKDNIAREMRQRINEENRIKLRGSVVARKADRQNEDQELENSADALTGDEENAGDNKEFKDENTDDLTGDEENADENKELKDDNADDSTDDKENADENKELKDENADDSTDDKENADENKELKDENTDDLTGDEENADENKELKDENADASTGDEENADENKELKDDNADNSTGDEETTDEMNDYSDDALNLSEKDHYKIALDSSYPPIGNDNVIDKNEDTNNDETTADKENADEMKEFKDDNADDSTDDDENENDTSDLTGDKENDDENNEFEDKNTDASTDDQKGYSYDELIADVIEQIKEDTAVDETPDFSVDNIIDYIKRNDKLNEEYFLKDIGRYLNSSFGKKAVNEAINSDNKEINSEIEETTEDTSKEGISLDGDEVVIKEEYSFNKDEIKWLKEFGYDTEEKIAAYVEAEGYKKIKKMLSYVIEADKATEGEEIEK